MIKEIRIRVYILTDIPLPQIYAANAEFIDSALAQDPSWLQYHEKNEYKQYCFSGLWPLEKDGIYKKDKIYTITIRTVDSELANYLSKTLRNHYTNKLKGLTAENRVVPQKMIGEIYTLTPVILKTDSGYWKNSFNVPEFERRIFENAVKKYKRYTGKDLDEDFTWYTELSFLNKKPIAVDYKGIRLLGDKIHLRIREEPRAQELSYFLLGSGIGEMNSRSFGYCNFRYL